MSSGTKKLFECTEPCGSCPYRTDAPLRLWAREEYVRLLETELDTIGSVYRCHTKNGSVCVGWLIDQDRRRLPSIALRMALSKEGVTAEYLDSLKSPAPLYGGVREMVAANYPELLDGEGWETRT